MIRRASKRTKTPSNKLSLHPSSKSPCSRSIRLFLSLLIGFICNNALVTATNDEIPKILSFDLHPSSQLLQNKKETGRRRLMLKDDDSNDNAIYASLPKQGQEDLQHLDAHHQAGITEFQAHRHLSRYERVYRDDNEFELHRNWNGAYDSFSRRRRRRRNLDSNHRKLRQATHNSDSYQTVPLHQGYGTHYAHLWVGTPTPQRVSVIVDTGSHVTAVPCNDCKNCGAEHHTDPYFNSTQSESFRVLECSECYMGATCVYPNPNAPEQEKEHCTFSQSYTEGSSWKAYQVEDVVYTSGSDVLASTNPNDMSHAIPFMFGCQTSANGLFVTQLANGIMGMSAYETTLAKQMYNQGKISHNMFSLCFRHELTTSKDGIKAGFMTLGGVDSRLETSSPMVYAKNMAKSGWYTVHVKNMYLRTDGSVKDEQGTKRNRPDVIKIPIDVSAVNSGKGVIVDSGTTDTYLNEKLESSFGAVWKQVTGTAYSHAPLSLTQAQVQQLPTVLIQIQAHDESSKKQSSKMEGLVGKLDPSAPHDVLLSIPPTHYMEFSPQSRQYTSRLYFTETSGGVIGANAMQGHNILFDWENGRVGFGKSSCEYKEYVQEQEDSSNVVSQQQLRNSSSDSATKTSESPLDGDCILSEPSLSKSCVESVDLNQCKHDLMDLEGTETWTRIVENPGTPSGRECADTVLFKTTYRGDESIRVECDGNGRCLEYRPCRLRCKDAAVQASSATTPLKPMNKGDSREGDAPKCAERLWGACDYSCNQSRMQSTLMSDGVCHETAVETRPCHVGVCGGSSDPCRVPYVVHTNLAFRGAKADLWSKRHEETLVEALSKSITALAPHKSDALFELGDVNVLKTSPTVISNQDGTRVNGLEVAVEISIFNANARYEETSNARFSFSDRFDRAVSAVLDSFQEPESSPSVATTTCEESDLYPLAQKALEIVDALDDDYFIESLIFGMKQTETEKMQNMAQSPLKRIYKQRELVHQSKVLSSWTQKTGSTTEEQGNNKYYVSAQLDNMAALIQVTKNCQLVGFVTGVLLIVWGVGMLCGCRVAKDFGSVRRLTSFESSVIETLRYLKTAEPQRRYYKQVSQQDVEDGSNDQHDDDVHSIVDHYNTTARKR